MYIIMKTKEGKTRRFNNKSFDTYAQGRQYVRKWIRRNVGIDGYNNEHASYDWLSDTGKYDRTSRNFPNISVLGFSVKKVA